MIKIKNNLHHLNNLKKNHLQHKIIKKIKIKKIQDFKKKFRVLLNIKKVLFPLIKQNLKQILVQ